MDQFVNEQDYKLLEKDKYTYQVLAWIVKGDCSLLFTNHSSIIICYSMPPYPVWIWTEDNCTIEVKEQVWNLLDQNDLLKSGMYFNVKNDVAEYMMKRAQDESIDIVLKTSLYAYECERLIVPHIKAEGELYRCTSEDIEKLVEIEMAFSSELHLDEMSEEEHRVSVNKKFELAPFFFWKDNNGNIVACCDYNVDNGKARIGAVYTYPEHRRKHYAENLVYEVSRIASDSGLALTLYTDGNYVASNSCYQKIGYELRGSLSVIGID